MQFLIETDILYDYLMHRSAEPSVLRIALSNGTCYTTMLNAMELFRLATTKPQRDAVLNTLMTVRVLGFNSRYSEPFAALASEIELQHSTIVTDREAMILAMAQTSKLTIVTEKYFERYSVIASVPVLRRVEAVPSI